MSAKRIILTGGGTGGHITPLLAVAAELKKQDPNCHIIYIGERNGKYAAMTSGNAHIDETRSIFAGKFRRYHGESWLRRLFAIKTNVLNLRDSIFFMIGTLQSVILLKRLKPDIILLKGGFVGVPIGLSAAFWHKPFITHDSDILPGLANRLVGRWALFHATGMPPENYGYPPANIRYVGVLVEEHYQPVSHEQQLAYKTALGVPADSMVLLATGGSGGAATINTAVRSILPELLERYPKLYVIHQVGRGKGGIYDDFSHVRLQIHELLKPMYQYTGASDLVITRAGANTMAELGVQGRACVVIPNPLLTGGHQLKNAEIWHEQSAARVVAEQQLKQGSRIFIDTICELLDTPAKRQTLGGNLQKLTVTDAAHKLAKLLLGLG
ncbi:UDP-N-acetylglucosamine--N-acetylmuramyl-(pentapeptide) pyrophosphoryl-undecaprenol N-acetylglucosamine transferase [Candidatus Saccharibacteria bacterium]|nr:UDP-N-acetylglucosamine--N-acetylmuramyl-(pentapeptide) pyrophosphoryl-undecaprenol N-acetylglucosamine transferase [Candidatus Saccharibacteria bacterium]